MKNRRTLILLIVLILAALYAFRRSGTRNPTTSTAQRKPAPDFSLPQPSGGPPLKLSDYRGRVVVLDFWATWCEPCRAEIPHFVDLQNKYADQGFQILGVAMDDSPDPVPAFVKQFKMNYPVVMGNAKIGEQYGGVLGLPIAFLIDRQGQIRKKHIGATEASVFEQEVTHLLAEK
jgi:thiol-disulfide isomerase/thioredoxin